MMQFKALTLESIPEIQRFLKKVNINTCDFTIGGMYMWRNYFTMQYTIEAGAFFSRLYDASGKEFYNLPLSDNIEESLNYLINELRKTKDVIRFCTIPESFLPIFEKNHVVDRIDAQIEYFDYLYATEDLVNLQGKKYSAQRNLIRQFTKCVNTWSFKKLTEDDIPAIRDFFLSNFSAKQDNPIAKEEHQMVLDVLDNFAQYGMIGGILIADQMIAGFSLGEISSNTLFVHVEKANRNMKGAYQMLANQFAIHFAKGKTLYINREEDMGDPGLKKAKEAYYPKEMLKKYTLEVH